MHYYTINFKPETGFKNHLGNLIKSIVLVAHEEHNSIGCPELPFHKYWPLLELMVFEKGNLFKHYDLSSGFCGYYFMPVTLVDLKPSSEGDIKIFENAFESYEFFKPVD